MNRNLRLRPASLVAAAVAIVLAQNAVAQQEPTALGEITVTARKRAESLQDVPFAISARTGDQLAAAGASNIEDVSRNIAGFTVLNLGPGQSQAAIRGVSGGKIDRDLPGVKEQIGVYMDESPISLSLFTPDLDLYDLNRVEVLRGPQGTLFGSGSIGGTVRYISNQPDLSDGYGDFEVGINTISDGGDGGFVRSMFNVPLGDRAALRVVGYFNEMPGFIDAHGPGGTLDQNVNDGERQGGRLALRWELTENVTITPRVIYQDIDVNGYNREDDWNMLANEFTTTQPRVNMAKREQFRQLDEHFDDDFFLGDLTMEFDMGPARAHVGQLVHGSRHPGDARRHAAERQRDLLQPGRRRRPDPSRTRGCSTTRRSRCSRRNCASAPITRAGSSGWSAASTATPTGFTGSACRRRATTPLTEFASMGPGPTAASYWARRSTTCRSSRTSRTRSSRSRSSRKPTSSSARRRTSRSAAATTTSRKTAC